MIPAERRRAERRARRTAAVFGTIAAAFVGLFLAVLVWEIL